MVEHTKTHAAVCSHKMQCQCEKLQHKNTNLKTQSTGEVTTVLSHGSWMGLSPAFSLLAKNWLKVSQPLGVLGLPSIMESCCQKMKYFTE